MRILNCNAFATVTVALMSLLSSAIVYADSLEFGVVGSPIDLSANVHEAILPGGTVFQDSKPLFGTAPDPKQSAELLHLSAKGVNASPRSNINSAFASSLAESNGNGGVGVSQLLFGDPGAPGQNAVRQLVGQSLWTQTFVYNGSPAVDFTLHLHIPALEVGLIGVPPNRNSVSATETAEASARVDTVITHADGSFSKGGSFEFGLREHEIQLLSSPPVFTNFAVADFISTNEPLFDSFHCPDFVNPDNPCFSDPVSTDVNLGVLHTGDTLAYVYTLTAQGTTHGGEHGYSAFLGDPFGVEVVDGNLIVTVAPAAAPEPSTSALTLLGSPGSWCGAGARTERAVPLSQVELGGNRTRPGSHTGRTAPSTNRCVSAYAIAFFKVSTRLKNNLAVPGPCPAQCLRVLEKKPPLDDFHRADCSLVKMRYEAPAFSKS